MDKNEVQVYDILLTGTPKLLFKALFRDSTGSLTRLFYLDPSVNYDQPYLQNFYKGESDYLNE